MLNLSSHLNNLTAHKTANQSLLNLLEEMENISPQAVTIDSAVLGTIMLCFMADDQENSTGKSLIDSLDHYGFCEPKEVEALINKFLIEINGLITKRRFDSEKLSKSPN